MSGAALSEQAPSHSELGFIRVVGAGIADRLARGVVAGIFAGMVFLVLNMGWATLHLNKPAIAPLLDISTIFNNTDQMPKPEAANMVIGLVTHLSLSMLFGMSFAILVVPFLRNAGALALGAVGFGLLVYVVNVQILGRIFFEWFTNSAGPPQVFEIWAHAIFGAFLFPFFIGLAYRVHARATTEE